MKKTLLVGSLPGYPDVGPHRHDVFVVVSYGPDELNPGKPGPVLSLTGTVGPRRNGDAWGSSGQIAMGFAHRDPAHDDGRYPKPTPASDFEWAPGWDAERWLDLLDVWHHWHANGMRSGCEHQRALGWTYAEHPSEECPECGYKMGTAWLYEPVPDDVVAFLDALPEATKPHPWERV